MHKNKLAVLLVLVFSVVFAKAQSTTPPSVSQVLLYSAVQSNGQFASVYTYTGTACTSGTTGCPIGTLASPQPGNYSTTNSIFGLTRTLNASIATALSIIPVASPASGVITKTDPATGAQLPASSTLGPIFTERGETIGRHRLYVGLSNQDFSFKSFAGQSLRPLQLMDVAGVNSTISASGTGYWKSFPATFNVAANIYLSQYLTFVTYGLTGRVDVSVGIPVVNAAVSAHTYNGQIFVGDGLNANAPMGISTAYGNGLGGGQCWCLDTFTPGSPPVNSSGTPTGAGLTLANVNSTALAKAGLGDLLVRVKGSVIERPTFVLALGADLRLPTGDAKDFLGTGATAIKPFAALSFYSRPLNNWLVFSPHLNVGWQISGTSILGGQYLPASLPTMPPGFGTPLTVAKGYLPDVFSWAVGSEIALGHHNTVVLDVLGNQVGWIHGVPNMVMESRSNVPAPSSTTAVQLATASGFVPAGTTSYGEYDGAFGYKARIVGDLVATFNMLVRFDNNGLVARATPLFGLGYTF